MLFRLRIEELVALVFLAPTTYLTFVAQRYAEQNALVHSAPKDRFPAPGVGPHRAGELSVLLDPDIRAMIKKKGIVLISYTDLWKEKR